MGIYEGLLKIKKEGANLEVCPLFCRARIIYSHKPDFAYTIQVNEELGLEESVKSFLHEITHLAPEFIGYGGLHLGESHPIELEITRQAHEIYKSQPRLDSILRRMLKSAKDCWRYSCVEFSISKGLADKSYQLMLPFDDYKSN